MSQINLDTIFQWRNTNQIIPQLQIYGVIPQNGKIKCPVVNCKGYMNMMADLNVSDGCRWSCDGIIRRSKRQDRKCRKR